MHSFALSNAQVTHRGRKKSAHSGLALGFGWCIFKMMWTCAGCPLHVPYMLLVENLLQSSLLTAAITSLNVLLFT